MVLTKRFLLRIFFGFEVLIFLLVYLFGAQGLHIMMKLRKENMQLGLERTELQKEVKQLETQVLAWQQDPFYKEKAARETLHMARKNDQVYLIG